MKTPVAFFIFKRPDTTEKVFEAIRPKFIQSDSEKSHKIYWDSITHYCYQLIVEYFLITENQSGIWI